MTESSSTRGRLTRRGFLKTAGAAAGVAGLAGVASMATADGWLAPASAEAAPEEHVARTYHQSHCGGMCSLACTVRDGRMVKVQPNGVGNPDFQTICLKGISEVAHIYGKGRVQTPLKRVGERGSGQFEPISWDEALDIMESEIRRIIDTYGAYSVLTIGEDGHRESKNLHSGGGMHSTLMSKLGGYTREVRTPDSVEGWYWGAKHFWGSGCNKGLGMPAPPQTGYNPWHVLRDISEHSEMIAFAAGDWELTQNYASQLWSRLLKFWEECGKKFVVIDRSATTRHAAMTTSGSPILPNTDAALDFAVMYVWFTEGPLRQGVLRHPHRRPGQGEGVRARHRRGGHSPKTPAWAAERTGIPEYTIKAYARNRAPLHHSIGALQLRRHQGPLQLRARPHPRLPAWPSGAWANPASSRRI